MGMSLCRRWMTIGGVNLDTFNCHLLMPGISSAPERDVNVISVPGRNGDLVIDNGRFKNITIEYKCVIDGSDSQYDFERLMAWLKSLTGYQRIEECYHSDYYRMGLFNAVVNPEEQNTYQVAFTLTANCKPQKYLLSGATEQTFELMALDTGTNELTTDMIGCFEKAILYDAQWRSGMTASDWLPALKNVIADGDDVITRAQCVAALDLTTGGVDVYALWQSLHGGTGNLNIRVVIDRAYGSSFMSLFKVETGGWRGTVQSGTHLPIYNPTPFTSKPSIRFYAKNTNGSNQQFVFGNFVTIEMNPYLEDADKKFIIDSETYNAYCVNEDGTTYNGNQYVTTIGILTLPELYPGQNYIMAHLSTDNTLAAEVYAFVTPRWFMV